MIRLSPAGRALLAYGALASLLGLAAGSRWLAASGALALALLLADAAYLAAVARGRVRFRPLRPSVHLPRGSEAEAVLVPEGRPWGDVVVPGASVEGLGGAVAVRARLARAGTRLISSVLLRRRSPLRLAEAEAEAPVRPPLELVAYPVAPALLAPLLHAGAGRLPAFPGSPLPPLVGPGTEYAYTDEMREGDEPRRVDWRATARAGKLMVKRYWAEGLSSVALVVDLTATDEESADELAVEAAKLLSWLPQAYPEAKIYLYDGRSLSLARSPADAAAALLRSLGRFYPEAARVLDEYPGLRPALAEAGGVAEARAVAVTQLLSPLLSMLPPGSVIVQPTRPWLSAPGLEEAYVLRRRHDRLAAMARAAGCAVVRTAEEAAEALGAAWRWSSLAAPQAAAGLEGWGGRQP